MINSTCRAQLTFEGLEVLGNLVNSSADFIPRGSKHHFGALNIILHAFEIAVKSFDQVGQRRQILNQIQQCGSGNRTSYIVHWDCTKGLDNISCRRLLILRKPTETVIGLRIEKYLSNALGIVARYQTNGEECSFFSIVLAVLNGRSGSKSMLRLSLTQNVRREKRCNSANGLYPRCGFRRSQAFFRILKYRTQCNKHKCEKNNNKEGEIPASNFLFPSSNHEYSKFDLSHYVSARRCCKMESLS